MSDAVLPTFVDSIVYWAPGALESTGREVFDSPQVIKTVRIDESVNKEIRDLLQGVVLSATVWSIRPFVVGGWLCRRSDFNDVTVEREQLPQLIEGARQIRHTEQSYSYDRTRVFYMAVI